jgi:hypothetical protein
MGLFSRKKNQDEESVEYDPYDTGRAYEAEENHSLPIDRAGITSAQFRTLFKLNIAAAIIQAASAGAIFGLIDNDITYPFYTNYPKSDEEGRPVFGPDPKVAFNLNVGWLTGVFLGLSALDHLLVCTCCKGVYERGLSKNFNVFRWVEYALSASLMRVLVGILSGVTDLHMQLLQFGLTAVTMLFGMIFELESKKNRLSEHDNVRWYLYWLGFIPHVFSWTVILAYFFYSLSTGDPPGFVYAIIFIIFALDISFAIILGLQWLAKGCFRPYVNGEIAFIILSFTSKNLLAWINFVGGSR